MYRIKRVCLFFIITFSTVTSYSQNAETDSLKNLLANTTADTTKVYLLYKISDEYSLSALDTAMQYARQALHLAEQSGYLMGQARSLTRIGNIYSASGDFDKSLESHFKSLSLSENMKDAKGTAASYNNIGLVYTKRNLQEDYRNAVQNFKRSKEYYEKLKDNPRLSTVLLNIGDAYEKMNILDSAFYFSSKAYDLALKINDYENLGAISVNLGFISYKKDDFQNALKQYRAGVNYMQEAEDNYTLATAWQSMSLCFDKLNKPDSSFYYAKKALLMAKETSNSVVVLDAAKQLSKLFAASGKYDSAYVYKEMAAVADSAINNNEKTVKIENLKLQEKIRQQLLEEARVARKEKRSYNIQMFTIVGFIVTFFIALVILSQKKIHPKAIELLSVLGLLLVFELLTFILHGYIGDLTHHSPVYTLIVLVGIAALLGPLHHKLTHWLKRKLIHKHHHAAQPEHGEPSKNSAEKPIHEAKHEAGHVHKEKHNPIKDHQNKEEEKPKPDQHKKPGEPGFDKK